MLLYHLLLNIVRKISKLEKNVGNVYDTVYPIGSVYITIDQVDLSTESNTIFPGTTWEPIAAGKTLFGSTYWFTQKGLTYERGRPEGTFYEERQYTTELGDDGSRPHLESSLPNIQGLAGNSLSDWDKAADGSYRTYELGGNNKLFNIATTNQYPGNWSTTRGSSWNSTTGTNDAFRTLYFNANKANEIYGRYESPSEGGNPEVIPPAIVVYIWRRIS